MTTPHCCTAEGHCRAQRFEMDALNARAAWEAEKAAIVSYEDGWVSIYHALYCLPSGY